MSIEDPLNSAEIPADASQELVDGIREEIVLLGTNLRIQKLCSLVGQQPAEVEHASADLHRNQTRQKILQSLAATLIPRHGQKGIKWDEWIDQFQAPEDFHKLFTLLGIDAALLQNHAQMSSAIVEIPTSQGVVKISLCKFCKIMSRRFKDQGGWRGFVAFFKGQEAYRTLSEQLCLCTSREDIVRWLEGMGVYEKDDWRNTGWWSKQRNRKVGYKKMSSIPGVIRKDPRFPTWGNFLAFMDGKQFDKTYMPFPEAVSSCHFPLDFLVYFAALGVPEDKWENSEWLSEVAGTLEQVGGMDRSLIGLVSAIRKDPRFGHSYPQFVAWMYGEQEVPMSATERVHAWQNRTDADRTFDEMNIPQAMRTDYQRLIVLAKERATEGTERSTFHKLSEGSVYSLTQAIFDRWSRWVDFVAWYERGKDSADATYRERIRACADAKELSQYFQEIGIPKGKERNSHWLQSLAQKAPPIGIGKILKSVVHAVVERFGTFREYIAFMDGMPEEGITSSEIADQLIMSEAGRLHVPIAELCGRYSVLTFWRKSPILVRVLQYFAEIQETKIQQSITTEKIIEKMRNDLSEMETASEQTHDHKENVDRPLRNAYYQEVVQKLEAVIRQHGDIHDRQNMEILCKILNQETNAIPLGNLPSRVRDRVHLRRCKAKTDLEVEAGWSVEPIRSGNILTENGISALNIVRERSSLEKIFKNEEQFLRDQITEEENRGLEVIAAELGEAARAEYLCAKYPDRIQYNHRTVLNLRGWLGKVEIFGGNPLAHIPLGLLTIDKLDHLKAAFFNRMRDKYHLLFRQGLDRVRDELVEAQIQAQHPLQKQFIEDLIHYFEETERIPRPSRLKTSVRDGEEFPAKHQKIAIKETKEHRSVLLADEMGGGKTGSAIATFEHLRERGEAHRALIMCPAQIMPVWKKALTDGNGGYFELGQAPNVVFIESGMKDWEKAVEADYVVMSIEMSRSETVIGNSQENIDHPDNALAKRLQIYPGEHLSHEKLAQELGADFFALDEAHNVKRPEGEDTDRIYRISQSESILAGHLLLLSGTPIPNTVRDIAAQIRLLYTGREEVTGVDVTDVTMLARVLTRQHPLLTRNLLVRRMLRRSTEDCLPVSNEFYRDVIEADLNPIERAQYDAIIHCPFYEATEKIRLLRKLCLLSETKYKQVCAAIEQAIERPKYNGHDGVSPKIVVAESWFAKGVTRDEDDRHGVDDANVDSYIAGRLETDYKGLLRVFVLDGQNSSKKEAILHEFESCIEPAVLITLTSVSGEGLDISCASDGILITPTETVSKEEQLARRMNRLGQEKDVHMQILQMRKTIEQGLAEYAARKAQLVEEFLNGRPLTAEEEKLLEDDTGRVESGGFLAYEVMSPREKVMWIISRIYGKGKEAVREFFELDEGKYAKDLAEFYPLEEETSYPGNTARLITALLQEYLPSGPIAMVDIACGCRTMERMFREKPEISVSSVDINKAMLETGDRLLGRTDSPHGDEIRAMDELPYKSNSKDAAILSLALHYTKHNPKKRAGEPGRERIDALCEMNRVLKKDGIGILTFPTNAFVEQSSFNDFCLIFERYFGFRVIHERTGFAQSTDNDEEPFSVWVLALQKIDEANPEKMDEAAWMALAFTKISNTSNSDAPSTSRKNCDYETGGAFHKEFVLGTEPITFLPLHAESQKVQQDQQFEKEKYCRLKDRLSALIQFHKAIERIPEEMLLSISLEEVDQATQEARDEYFRLLLLYYGNINRVPFEDIANESPVIIIRSESRKGKFLCLGRIDGTTKKPCGYGRRYFYNDDLTTSPDPPPDPSRSVQGIHDRG